MQRFTIRGNALKLKWMCLLYTIFPGLSTLFWIFFCFLKNFLLFPSFSFKNNAVFARIWHLPSFLMIFYARLCIIYAYIHAYSQVQNFVQNEHKLRLWSLFSTVFLRKLYTILTIFPQICVTHSNFCLPWIYKNDDGKRLFSLQN